MQFNCPHCGLTQHAHDSLAGQVAHCHGCGRSSQCPDFDVFDSAATTTGTRHQRSKTTRFVIPSAVLLGGMVVGLSAAMVSALLPSSNSPPVRDKTSRSRTADAPAAKKSVVRTNNKRPIKSASQPAKTHKDDFIFLASLHKGDPEYVTRAVQAVEDSGEFEQFSGMDQAAICFYCGAAWFEMSEHAKVVSTDGGLKGRLLATEYFFRARDIYLKIGRKDKADEVMSVFKKDDARKAQTVAHAKKPSELFEEAVKDFLREGESYCQLLNKNNVTAAEIDLQSRRVLVAIDAIPGPSPTMPMNALPYNSYQIREVATHTSRLIVGILDDLSVYGNRAMPSLRYKSSGVRNDLGIIGRMVR